MLLLDADDQLNIPAGEKNFVVTDSMELPVDVEVLLDRAIGKWKLSQNRSDEDIAGVIEGLDERDSLDAKGVAERMRELGRT